MNVNTSNVPGLVYFVCQDFVGLSRGRGFLRSDLSNRIHKGVGWVPANLALNPFSQIVENPWGAYGDLILLPDVETEVYIDHGIKQDASPLHYFLSDIVTLDGDEYDACPRTFLRRQIARLAEHGIKIKASFEHEFMLTDIEQPAPSFSLAAGRKEDLLSTKIMQALSSAGIEPEMCLPEYSPRQYEVTCGPSDALQAADRAVHVREIVSEICRQFDRSFSFSPKVFENEGTNGVHIHYSLWNLDNNPLTYDINGKGGLSELATQFSAGVLEHMAALVGLGAPGVVSYQRLKAHSWSAAYSCIGERNREATLRIAPINTNGGGTPQKQFNVEFRAADVLASPYMILGGILAAGLDGIVRKLNLPKLTNQDPADIDPSLHAEHGIVPLPDSLEKAIDALKMDTVLIEAMGATMSECYLAVKQNEIKLFEGKTDDEIKRAYQAVY